jgi:hypothetical protein
MLVVLPGEFRQRAIYMLNGCSHAPDHHCRSDDAPQQGNEHAYYPKVHIQTPEICLTAPTESVPPLFASI